MVFGSSPAIGLDIGASSVKVVQMRRSGSGVEVEKLAIADVAMGNDVAQAKTDAIKRAMADAKITGKQVVTGVSGESIIVRYVRLPEMPEEELRSALRFEAEEWIPYSLDDVYLDSDTLGKSTDDSGSKVDVLLVAAKKDLVQEHLSVVRAAGLTTTIIDLDSLAFFNCFERNYQPKADEAVALVNIGRSVTNVNVYHGGVSRFSRDIEIAGDTITNTIQLKLNGSYEDAERLKIAEGLPSVDAEPESGQTGSDDDTLMRTIRGSVERITQQDLNEDNAPEEAAQAACKQVCNNLITEIRRSLQFFESQPNARPVTRVVLGGGTARMRNLTEMFSAELGMPAETIDPFARVSLGGRRLNAADISENKTALGVSVGLALRKVAD